jgi:periplasmic copper chaperone A
MKIRISLAFLIVVLLATACAAQPAASVGSIQINTPWVMAASASGNTAAFMVIKNTGSQADRLVKAEFKPAKMVQLMNTVETNGKMGMVNVDAIDIPAGGQVELKSGGFHVMLMNLSEELADGNSASLTLTFEKAGAVTFTLPIKAG